jgi:hypothetical protein
MNRYLHSVMDHRYIDEHSVAERYAANELGSSERSAFEAHLVDCQECTDRLLLAEMFHSRQPDEPRPATAQLIVRIRPRQLILIAAIGVLLLLVIPATLIFVWELLSK